MFMLCVSNNRYGLRLAVFVLSVFLTEMDLRVQINASITALTTKVMTVINIAGVGVGFDADSFTVACSLTLFQAIVRRERRKQTGRLAASETRAIYDDNMPKTA